MDIYYVDCVNNTLLKTSDNNFLCHSFSNIPFRIQKITLSPNNERSKNIIQTAKSRLSSIQFNSASSSGVTREEIEIKLKSFCGLIIEQLCFSMLTHYNKNPNVVIELDSGNNSIDQIDLKIHKKWLQHGSDDYKSLTKTVEIRSSFPFKSIEKVVSQDFDILGGYKNDIKKGEIEKDFYLRFLFALDYKSDYYVKENGKIHYGKTTTKTLKECYFDNDLNLKRELVIFFIGGATNAMMLDESIAYLGSMTSSNFNINQNAEFKKIKVRNGLDCIAIMQMMLNVITTEASQGK